MNRKSSQAGYCLMLGFENCLLESVQKYFSILSLRQRTDSNINLSLKEKFNLLLVPGVRLVRSNILLFSYLHFSKALSLPPLIAPLPDVSFSIKIQFRPSQTFKSIKIGGNYNLASIKSSETNCVVKASSTISKP